LKKERLKKCLPGIICLFLILLSFASFPVAYFRLKNEKEQFAVKKERAESCFQKQLYTEAAALYEEIVKEEPKNTDALEKLCICHMKDENEEAFLDACNLLIGVNPASETGYVLLCQWHESRQNYSSVYSVIETAKQSGCISDTLAQKEKNLNGLFVSRFFTADEVFEWHKSGSNSYSVFSLNGKNGIIRGDGNVSLSAEYENLGMYDYSEGVMPVTDANEVCYIGTDGKRKLVPDMSLDFAGCFGSGLAPVSIDGKFCYVNRYFSSGGAAFEFAGSFSNGVAAVKNDGKWALVSDKLISLTPFTALNVKLNSYGFCADYGLVVMQDENGWFLSDLKGVRLSDFHEDIALPASEDGYIAFCDEGKWGFMDKNGVIVIEPTFDEAKSFSCGLAPVRSGDKWYYIGEDGNITGSETFEYAGTFSDKGCAFVRQRGCSFLYIMSKYY